MERGLGVTVSCQKPNGEPVPGVVVQVTQAAFVDGIEASEGPGWHDKRAVVWGISNEAGTCLLAGLHSGEHRLRIDHPRLAAWNPPRSIDANLGSLQVVMAEVLAYEVIVVGDEVVTWSNVGSVKAKVSQSSHDGLQRLQNRVAAKALDAGNRLLVFSPPQLQRGPSGSLAVVSPMPNVDFTVWLRQRGRHDFRRKMRVWDEEFAPEVLDVSALPVTGGFGEAVVTILDRQGRVVAGDFSLIRTGPFPQFGAGLRSGDTVPLLEGAYRLAGRDPGWQSARFTGACEVRAGRRTEATITLDPGVARCEWQAVLGDGGDTEGVTVVVKQAEAIVTICPFGKLHGELMLPEGTYTFEFKAHGYQPVVQRVTLSGVEKTKVQFVMESRT